MATPDTLAYLYTSTTAVNNLLSQYGTDLRLDDDQDGVVSAAEAAVLSGTIVNEATAEINDYLYRRYAPDQLATSWSVYRMCTLFAALLVCQRRGNPVADSLQQLWDKAELRLERIQEHTLDLGGIAERESDQMGVVNMTLDARYDVRQLRVERPLSDQTPTNSPGPIHWPSEFAQENW